MLKKSTAECLSLLLGCVYTDISSSYAPGSSIGAGGGICSPAAAEEALKGSAIIFTSPLPEFKGLLLLKGEEDAKMIHAPRRRQKKTLAPPLTGPDPEGQTSGLFVTSSWPIQAEILAIHCSLS